MMKTCFIASSYQFVPVIEKVFKEPGIKQRPENAKASFITPPNPLLT